MFIFPSYVRPLPFPWLFPPTPPPPPLSLLHRCIEKEWNLTKEQSGVDFRKLFASLKDEVGVIKEGVYTELERLIWTNY